MRQKQKINYLQKPKRIRKSKKDFLRGSREQMESKMHYDNTIIPLPYILLFSLLAATIIGYTSITFLFGRIHIDAVPLYNFIRSSLSSVHVPHVKLPMISISTPHIPALPVPSINLPPLFTLLIKTANVLLKTTEKDVSAVLPYLNLLPLLVEIFMKTAHFLINTILWIFTNLGAVTVWTSKAVQTNFTILIKSIHPAQIMKTLLSFCIVLFFSGLKIINNGSLWVFQILGDYLVLLGNFLSITGTFLQYLILNIGRTLFQATITIVTALIEMTVRNLSLLLQTITTAISITSTFIISILLFTFQEITIFLVWQWNVLRGEVISTINVAQTVYTFLLHVTILLFQGILYGVESTLKFIFYILMIIFNWMVSIVMATKRTIDNTLGTIGAFIHLGDPLYQAIGASINDLFSSMGATASLTGKAVEGGKL